MKKKVLGVLLSTALVLSLVGCGAKDEPAAETATTVETTEAAEVVDESATEEAEATEEVVDSYPLL